MDKLIRIARHAKHRGFVASKRIRWASRDAALWLNDRRWALAESLHPFVYDESRYPHTFLTRKSPVLEGPFLEAPRQLWSFWLGGELTPPRRRAIRKLKSQDKLSFLLVTQPSQILVKDSPLHPAYYFLNPMHKSDYLRAYVMHHHGGIYADIKDYPKLTWEIVDLLNKDAGTWVVGYREDTSNYTPDLAHALGHDVKRHYRATMGPSAFACRPRTPFTEEWLRELNARMDYYAGALAEANAGDSSPYKRPSEYPIRWSEICGDIIQPLSLKHQTHVLFTDAIKPVLHSYR